MPKATEQTSGRGGKSTRLLVYPSGHMALELYAACERKAKSMKNIRDSEEATEPLPEATLGAGDGHLPVLLCANGHV